MKEREGRASFIVLRDFKVGEQEWVSETCYVSFMGRCNALQLAGSYAVKEQKLQTSIPLRLSKGTQSMRPSKIVFFSQSATPNSLTDSD